MGTSSNGIPMRLDTDYSIPYSLSLKNPPEEAIRYPKTSLSLGGGGVKARPISRIGVR
jgi:hypothetical protein